MRRATGIVQNGGRSRILVAVALTAAVASVPWPRAHAGMPAAEAAPAAPAAWWGPLARPPLDPPLDVTGDFGEYRTGHFHAGLDFSTGGVVGRPVHAALDGEIVRIRTSGVGYGRSLYLEGADGRLLVYGHLDALDEPFGSYVEATQDSSGQYEQDLWPEKGRFPVRAGQRLGWTGNSGAGGPHFHFEIRRVDMAYNPPRAGLGWPDSIPPRIAAVWLEPLDDTSMVERSPAPRRVALGARADTVRVHGRVRAIVDAWDPAAGGDRMGLWSTRLEWGGRFVELRMDSVSWADGMSEIDYVYDRGRASDAPRRALVPWASASYRPRMMVTDVPAGEEAGTLRVAAGDPARPLRIVATDLAGRVCERAVWLCGAPPGASGPDTARAGGAAAKAAIVFGFDPLPDGFVRVRVSGAPRGSRAVRLTWKGEAGESWAVAGGRTFVGVVRVPARIAEHTLVARGRDAAGAEWSGSAVLAVAADRAPRAPGGAPTLGWSGLTAACFEPSAVLERPASTIDAPRELAPASAPAWELVPALTALRRPFTLAFTPPPGADPERLSLYQDDGSGWSWVRSTYDAATRTFRAESRRLGRFALFEDRTAPRITPLRPPRRAVVRSYSRWALEARLADDGAGIDARGSFFRIDGARVASEWDAEAGVLRWKPRAAPAKGGHAYEVVAVDRAGNRRVVAARFVLD